MLRILRRRIWLVLIPLSVVSAATAVATRQLPDRYRSDTLILVVPQRVPEAYVKSTVTTRIEDRLHSISQQILSRTRLERVIQDFDLYAKERRDGIMEDIVEQMRDDIRVDVVKGDAFRVSYIGNEPRTVMKVTARLASLFIEENLRDREVLAEGTNQFLEAQLGDARRRLMDQESKLETYRRQHAGELPSQLESNMQLVQNTQVQIQSILEAINRDQERRLILERQLADIQSEIQATREAPSPAQLVNGDGMPTNGTTAQQIAHARATLQALELRFKPDHPDLGIWRRRLRDLEKKAEKEALEAPVSSPASAASAPEAARQRRLADLKAELEQLDRQIKFKQGEERQLRSVAAGVQARISVAPTRESEMAELTRDYATLQTMYASLLTKKEDSKIAANLESKQIGEQFKLLDPARIPEKPFSPNRLFMNMAGLGGGLAIGLLLVGLLEYRDATFKTDEEVSAILGLPVLAVVPSMRSDHERRRHFRRRTVLGIGFGSTVTACLGLVVYTLLR